MLEVVVRRTVVLPSSLCNRISWAFRSIEGHRRIQSGCTFSKLLRLLLLITLPTSLTELTPTTCCAFHPKWSRSTWLSSTKLWLWVIEVRRRINRLGPSFFTIWNNSHRLVLLIVVTHYRLKRGLTADTGNLQSCLPRLSQFNAGARPIIRCFLFLLDRRLFICAQWNLLNVVLITRCVPCLLNCLKCWSLLRSLSFNSICTRNARFHLFRLISLTIFLMPVI